jgi:exportin-T
VFVCDYPKRWPNFFTDLLQTLSLGPHAIDLYLRVLLAIDSEVVDREILHSKEEADRNTLIKDHMRETCVDSLVDSWYHILVCNIISVSFTVINLSFINSRFMKRRIPIWYAKH